MNLINPGPVRPPTADERSRLALISEIVDKLGPLDIETAPWLPKIRDAEGLRKQLRALYDSSPAADPFEAKGEKYTVTVGPKSKQTVIAYPLLWKLAGISIMRRIATATLGAIETACGKEVAARVSSSELTGYRKLTVVVRAEEKKAA
jgi:hypothetical protein